MLVVGLYSYMKGSVVNVGKQTGPPVTPQLWMVTKVKTNASK